jgi:hypothetical protein
MKRAVVSALSVFLVAALLGLTGCEGGGVETGMPDAAAKPDIPLDGKANMATGETPPPSVAKKPMPTKGTDPAPAAEKDGTKN